MPVKITLTSSNSSAPAGTRKVSLLSSDTPGTKIILTGGGLPLIATPTLSVTINSSSQVTATSSSPTGTAQYYFQIALNSGFNSGVQSTLESVNSKIFNSLSPSTTYYLRVRASGSGYENSAFSTIQTVTTSAAADNTAPTVPSNLRTSSITPNSFTLIWDASTDAVGVTGYDVYRNGTYLATTGSTSYNVTGLSASTSYNMSVRAKDQANNISASSTVLPVTTAQPADTTAPTIVSRNTTDTTHIQIVFSESVNATLAGWLFNNGSTLTPSAVTGSGTTWIFTVPTMAYGQTITSSYNSSTGNTVDSAGNELVSFTGVVVNNNLAAPNVPGEVPFYLLLSQSNGGWAAWSEASSGVQSTYGGEKSYMKIWNPARGAYGAIWENLTPGVNTADEKNNNSGTGVGWETGFAVAMQNYAPLTERRIYKQSQGATSLFVDWENNPEGGSWNQFKQWIDLACSQAQQQGKVLRLKGIGWMHGEEDSKTLSYSNAYGTKLPEFFQAIDDLLAEKASTYGHIFPANVKKAIGRIRFLGVWVNADKIRAAQEAFCANPANNAVLIDTDGYSLREGDMAHYSADDSITKFGAIDLFNVFKDL